MLIFVKKGCTPMSLVCLTLTIGQKCHEEEQKLCYYD